MPFPHPVRNLLGWTSHPRTPTGETLKASRTAVPGWLRGDAYFASTINLMAVRALSSMLTSTNCGTQATWIPSSFR